MRLNRDAYETKTQSSSSLISRRKGACSTLPWGACRGGGPPKKLHPLGNQTYRVESAVAVSKRQACFIKYVFICVPCARIPTAPSSGHANPSVVLASSSLPSVLSFRSLLRSIIFFPYLFLSSHSSFISHFSPLCALLFHFPSPSAFLINANAPNMYC